MAKRRPVIPAHLLLLGYRFPPGAGLAARLALEALESPPARAPAPRRRPGRPARLILGLGVRETYEKCERAWRLKRVDELSWPRVSEQMDEPVPSLKRWVGWFERGEVRTPTDED